MNIRCSIIIVSHNAKDYTIKAVDSIYQTVKKETLKQIEVIVVENNSNDGSYQALQKYVHLLRLICLDHTVGFGEANNLGAEQAKGTYLFFLNPDTEIKPGAIDILLRELETHPEVGAVSGQLLNADGSIQPQGGTLPNLFNIAAWWLFPDFWIFSIDDLPIIGPYLPSYQQRSLPFFKNRQETGWIGGTALMISKSLFEKVGKWDQDIFLYGEDLELCWRLYSYHKKIVLNPEAKIIHHQHKSVGGSRRARLGEIEGLLYLWRKHFPSWQFPLLKIILVVGIWLRVVLFGILLGNEEKKSTYLEAARRVAMAG